MKKYVLKPGEKGVSALDAREMTARELEPFEVSVRVRAASLNYRDLITANQGVNRELIPLSDGAGTVEELGSGVTRLQKGDRVVGLFFPRWQGGEIDHYKFSSARGGEPTDGMLAQMVYGPEDSFLKFPDYLSFEEASTLPCAGLTAWNALVVKGKLKPGETILIMGTGGVALFALQLAKTMGARVILLSSSERKIEKARRMGADEIINYKESPNWEEVVWEKTSRLGADLVLELGRRRDPGQINGLRAHQRADQPGRCPDRIHQPGKPSANPEKDPFRERNLRREPGNAGAISPGPGNKPDPPGNRSCVPLRSGEGSVRLHAERPAHGENRHRHLSLTQDPH